MAGAIAKPPWSRRLACTKARRLTSTIRRAIRCRRATIRIVLGVVRGVEFRAGEGLFGDLHFNPQHAFGATRLGRRARAAKRRHVAQCAGPHASKMATKRSSRRSRKCKASTWWPTRPRRSGLYEQCGAKAELEQCTSPQCVASSRRHRISRRSKTSPHRPELITEIEQRLRIATRPKFEPELDEMLAKEQAAASRADRCSCLQEFDLPLPTARDGELDGSSATSLCNR